MAATTKNKPAAKKNPGMKPPSEAELKACLGDAFVLWIALVCAVGERFSPLEEQWNPAKTLAFGRYCRLRRKDKNLLYMLPEQGGFKVALILGERAAGLAITSALPAAMKKRIAEAKQWPEGRDVRFAVKSEKDVALAAKLVELKTTLK